MESNSGKWDSLKGINITASLSDSRAIESRGLKAMRLRVPQDH